MKMKDFIVMLLPCAVLAGMALFFARREADQANREAKEAARAAKEAALTKPFFYKAGKFVVRDIIVGTGAPAVAGRTLTAHYSGMLTDGKKFDSSWQRGIPFSFTIGGGEVIAGWDKGLLGMRVGGKRRLIIPPSMGYGATGSPPTIPPNSTLIFDVQLLNVQ